MLEYLLICEYVEYDYLVVTDISITMYHMKLLRQYSNIFTQKNFSGLSVYGIKLFLKKFFIHKDLYLMKGLSFVHRKCSVNKLTNS